MQEYRPGSAFPGVIARTVDESSPAWPEPNRAKAGAAQRPLHRPRRHGVRSPGLLRWPRAHAAHRPARRGRPALLEHAHDGPLLADALVHPHRPQPSLERHGGDHRDLDRLPGLRRHHPLRERVPLRDPPREGLRDDGRRQVAPDACRADQRGRALRPLAARPRLRSLLRLSRRRHAPVLPGAGPRQPPGRAAEEPEQGYHLTEDLVDKAIQFIGDVHVVAPDKPFFMYFCTGAMHAPHHVPKEWSDKYKGKFDMGWDKAPRGRLPTPGRARRRSARDRAVAAGSRRPAWDSLSADEKRLYARMMEVYAGFLEHTDHHIGRLIDALESAGKLDDTLIMLISDNGASAEGGKRFGQREPLLQLRARVARGQPEGDRRARRPQVLQPLPVRLGARRQHPVPPVEAGDLPRRRERSVHRPLAGWHPRARREAHAVRARHRHAADGARGHRDRGAGRDPGSHAEPDRGDQLRVLLRRRRRHEPHRHAVLRDARPPIASTTTAGGRCARGRARRSSSRGASSERRSPPTT